jgi:hypothetical protein
MATNEILRFCENGTPIDLLTQAEYFNDTQRPIGNQPATVAFPAARAKLVNKFSKQVATMSAGLGQFLADNQAVDITDDLTESALSTIIFNAFENVVSAESSKPGDYKDVSVPLSQPGWALCDGASYDMVGIATTAEIQSLGNLYHATGQDLVYGIGTDSHIPSHTNPSIIVLYEATQVGSSPLPNAHTSGFTVGTTQTGTPSLPQINDIQTIAASSMVPGGYFEMFAPSGRSTYYWFQIDGAGSAPAVGPTSLIQMVPILSTDTNNQVAQKLFDHSFLQYRVPFWNGQTARMVDLGAGVDPDAATRTDINGNVVGDVVGSYEQDALEAHTHDAPINNFTDFIIPQLYDKAGNTAAGEIFNAGPITGPVTSPAKTSTETRGKNISVYKLVKF